MTNNPAMPPEPDSPPDRPVPAQAAPSSEAWQTPGPPASGTVGGDLAEQVRNVAATSLAGVQRVAREHNVLAPIALLLSCLSLFTAGLLAPVGAVVGHISRRQIRRTGQTGGGMALAAILIGWSLTAVASCGVLLTAILVIVKGVTLFSLMSSGLG